MGSLTCARLLRTGLRVVMLMGIFLLHELDTLSTRLRAGKLRERERGRRGRWGEGGRTSYKCALGDSLLLHFFSSPVNIIMLHPPSPPPPHTPMKSISTDFQ